MFFNWYLESDSKEEEKSNPFEDYFLAYLKYVIHPM